MATKDPPHRGNIRPCTTAMRMSNGDDITWLTGTDCSQWLKCRLGLQSPPNTTAAAGGGSTRTVGAANVAGAANRPTGSAGRERRRCRTAGATSCGRQYNSPNSGHVILQLSPTCKSTTSRSTRPSSRPSDECAGRRSADVLCRAQQVLRDEQTTLRLMTRHVIGPRDVTDDVTTSNRGTAKLADDSSSAHNNDVIENDADTECDGQTTKAAVVTLSNSELEVCVPVGIRDVITTNGHHKPMTPSSSTDDGTRDVVTTDYYDADQQNDRPYSTRVTSRLCDVTTASRRSVRFNDDATKVHVYRPLTPALADL